MGTKEGTLGHKRKKNLALTKRDLSNFSKLKLNCYILDFQLIVAAGREVNTSMY